MADYIPAKDLEFDAWGRNFSTLITADPPRFQLGIPDAQIIQDAYDDFKAALDLAVDPTTKTLVTIAAKNGLKVTATEIFRAYAQQIKANLGVVQEDKVALGLNPNVGPGGSIPAPSTHPILAITGAGPGTHTIEFADETTPAKRAKPPGASHMELYVMIATVTAESPTPCGFRGTYTKSPIMVDLSPDDIGKRATYFGRWANKKGEVGPYSVGVSLPVT